MAGSGFKIASAWVDVSLSRDRLPEEMAALRADLEANSPTVNMDVDTGMATAKVDEFLASTEAKSDIAGQDSGDKMSRGLAQGVQRSSPLIMAAVGGALAAGAPVAIAAAGVLFAGIAAAAVHSNAQVQAAFTATGDAIKSTLTNAAQVTVPFFVNALDRIGSAVQGLGPQLHEAFAALSGPIASLTTGLINMAQNAMPGLVSAVQASGPVFQGLASLMSSVGTGIGQFFAIIAQHAPAAGQVFAALGSIVQSLLPILGQLLGAGAELASVVLPPLASAVHVVADALNFLAPVLPAVVAGFLALKVIQTLNGPLTTLAQNLAQASYSGNMFAGTAGKMSTAVSGLSSALPLLGTILVGYSQTISAMNQTSDKWAQALLAGGKAADTARGQMSNLQKTVSENLTGWNGFTELIGGNALAVAMAGKSAKDAQDQYKNLSAAQQQATSSTQGNTQAATTEANSLKRISDAAGAASSQLNMLKSSFDILTGAHVTVLDAEAAFTQALESAKTATQGLSGAIVDDAGHLNTHTAAGAAAEQALSALRDRSYQVSSAMINQGATAAEVTQRDGELRASFIQTAQNMGFSAQQAQTLANEILGIPSQHATTISTDISQSMSAIDQIRAAIAGIPNRTVYVNTVYNAGPAGYQVPGAGQSGYAQGGIVHAFASGGMESMDTMRGGIASIVPPNLLRVIGDRVTDDEAYIPINHSSRSLSILSETAQRMGRAVVPAAPPWTAMAGPSPAAAASTPTSDVVAAGGITVNGGITVQVSGSLDDPRLPRRVAENIRDALIRLERERR